LIPSGILHPGVSCVIGNGVVIDLRALFDEVGELATAGITVDGRLMVSDRAHLILPYHRDIDRLSEANLGTRMIGTTSRGIGPAYEDKAGRRGLRVCDLEDDATLEEQIRDGVGRRNRLAEDHALDWTEVLAQTRELGARLRPWIADVSVALTRAMAEGRAILFEGAQGTMLDLDHGTYPYVTSSNATVGGVCTGLGIGPRSVHAVVGIAKAYTTRVGEGPFPSELHGAEGDALRAKGNEFGAVTGRPRRCGWFDAVQVRHAVRVNGLDAIVITKMDVLDGLDAVPICVAYRVGDGTCAEFPADLRRLQRCTPIIESMPGWKNPTAGARRVSDLPAEARAYLERLEELTGVPVLLVSTGAAREDTVVKNGALTSAWFGSALT
jgi:adenylosuccinate synthase